MKAVIDRERWFVVVNPASGGGRALRCRAGLIAALDHQRVAYECVASESAGDVARLAARAAEQGYRRLLAVGGDGTFHELVNGLLASSVPLRECLVAAAAGGTGNDWASEMEVPDEPERLAARMARGQSRPVDIGLAACAGGGRLAFHNVAGAGLDADVIRRTPRGGPRALAYLRAIARTLARFRAPRFEIVADGRVIEGSFLLVMAAVGPRCGGGMRLAPGALVDDGWLDLLTIDPMTLMGAVARLPRLRDGRLAQDPAFRVVRCRSATIRAEPACGTELDGQEFGKTPLSVAVSAGALSALECREARA